jgi:DNA ligase-1
MDGAERRCFTIQSLAKALPRESELLAESYLKACVQQATLERDGAREEPTDRSDRVAGAGAPRRKALNPMLAPSKIPDLTKDLKFPLLASPKLDGIRAVVQGGKLLSRNMKEIRNCFTQRLFGSFGLEGLDGELICGPTAATDVFRRTSSGVMSEDGEPDVVYNVFDDRTRPEMSFERRLMDAGRRCDPAKRVCLVLHRDIHSVAELLAYEEEALSSGFEGVMIRNPAGVYKPARATFKEGLIYKLKRFQDSEAEILGVEPKYHNANAATTDALGHTKRSSHQEHMVALDTLGALRVRDCKTGVEFSIGSGFDDATRAELWALRARLPGRLVKYKSFCIGVKTAPRFPIFLGLRDRADLS